MLEYKQEKPRKVLKVYRKFGDEKSFFFLFTHTNERLRLSLSFRRLCEYVRRGFFKCVREARRKKSYFLN